MPVKNGNKVKVDYTGTLEDGTVFDSSEKHGKPLEFEAGSKQVIPGFDEAVVGMNKGEEKSIVIPPEKAYGQPDDRLVKTLPKNQLPPGVEPKAGMILGVTLPNGMQFPARIMEVNDAGIKLNLNHPLAGKTLKFKIKLVDFS